MKTEFSEFTYGFSLVNELAKTLPCTAVPIFPAYSRKEKKEAVTTLNFFSPRREKF